MSDFDVKKTTQYMYALVCDEREYQRKRIADPNLPDMIELDMPGLLLALDVTLTRAKQEWYSDSSANSYQNTMEHLRKAAALIFAAGEKYGMPERKRKWKD
jgi:hypothetical protein